MTENKSNLRAETKFIKHTGKNYYEVEFGTWSTSTLRDLEILTVIIKKEHQKQHQNVGSYYNSKKHGLLYDTKDRNKKKDKIQDVKKSQHDDIPKDIPCFYGFRKIDILDNSNWRLRILDGPNDNNRKGFRFRTWHETKVYETSASYICSFKDGY